MVPVCFVSVGQKEEAIAESVCPVSVPIDFDVSLALVLKIGNTESECFQRSEEKRLYYEKSGVLDGQKGMRVRWVKDIGRISSIMNS